MTHDGPLAKIRRPATPHPAMPREPLKAKLGKSSATRFQNSFIEHQLAKHDVFAHEFGPVTVPCDFLSGASVVQKTRLHWSAAMRNCRLPTADCRTCDGIHATESRPEKVENRNHPNSHLRLSVKIRVHPWRKTRPWHRTRGLPSAARPTEHQTPNTEPLRFPSRLRGFA